MGTTAKASLISMTSMSSMFMPAFFRAFSDAGVGAVSMMIGSSPAVAIETILALGFRLLACAYPGDAIRTAPAPSTIPDELPAV